MYHPKLTLSEYQEIAEKSNREPTKARPRFALLGLFGEAGSVLSEVKKKQRDEIAFRTYHKRVIEELGDLMWYIAAFSTAVEIDLDDVVRPVAVKVNRPVTKPDRQVRCADFDQDDGYVSYEPDENYQEELEELAGEVGLLVRDFEDSYTKEAILDQLTRIFEKFLVIVNQSGAQFCEVIEFNLNKISARWPEKLDYDNAPYFEHNVPSYEKFPRKLKVHIFEIIKEDGKSYFVIQRLSSLNIGDRLTDNIIREDDYRFHDVFHYAYASVLHWSPVLRSLLKIKRKSDPRLDEAEDGARAILIEEGISTLVFNQAKQLKLFENVGRGKLSFDLLKSISDLTRGYEVGRCPYWQWEEAILQGYEAFRFLKQHRSGTVVLDLDQRKLSISKLEIEAK